MKIKLKAGIMTASGTKKPGAVIDVDDKTAEQWIESGIAEVEKGSGRKRPGPKATKVDGPEEKK
ncbi:hypothetical protein LC040_12165 [Bacillus tianshenii]|nr:hypothetical protein LC040_12165 [Bacillus tianshenii]